MPNNTENNKKEDQANENSNVSRPMFKLKKKNRDSVEHPEN